MAACETRPGTVIDGINLRFIRVFARRVKKAMVLKL